MAEDYATFSGKIDNGIVDVTSPMDAEKSTLINRLSHAIIDLLGRAPVTDLPGAKDQYIAGLRTVLQTLYGSSQATPLAVNDAMFGGGSRSSRQTRRRRNGGKRNQRR